MPLSCVRFFVPALLLVLLIGAGGPVEANICAFDSVPAASLLFPFVTFDYNNPTSGSNTLIAITNLSHQAQIVHLTLWSDTAQRVLDLDLVLSGYDVQTISIRDVLHYGRLPVTGTAGGLVVDGPRPITDGPVARSNGYWLTDIQPDAAGTDTLAERCPPDSPHYPGHYAEGLTAAELAVIQQLLQSSQAVTHLHTDCAGSVNDFRFQTWWELRDRSGVTWFYITADVVQSCTGLFPDDPAYWAAGGPVSRSHQANVLTGDLIWVDDSRRFSHADKAVHLEVDEQLAEVATLDGEGNPISFAYRYSTLQGAPSDMREPLPDAWAVRFMGVGSTNIDTHLAIWKGSTFAVAPTDFELGAATTDTTSGIFLAKDCVGYTYWAWDEDEQVSFDIWGNDSTCGPECWDTMSANLLPLAVQEVKADELMNPGSNGWFLFAWPAANHGATATSAPVDRYQTWLGVTYAAFSRLSSFMTGTVAGNSNCMPDQVVPDLGIDYDYVDESGYRSARSQEGGDR